MKSVACCVLVLACLLAAVAGHPQFVYAGFDHVLAFDTKDVQVSAFDYRRHLPFYSTCDALVFPPLLEGVAMEDWLSNGARDTDSHEDLTYTHVGYEVFLVENKVTGAYVVRRCRDFRPQLNSLPCEAFATGTSDKLKKPFRTIFIGNNRVMILNTETAEFTFHPFDSDVHTGGDPFKFTFGPLASGVFPNRDGLAESNFAYVQLKNNGGDLLLIQKPEGVVQGWRFHGSAQQSSEVDFRFAFLRPSPHDQTMTTLGENQALFFDSGYFFTVWDISRNDTDGQFVVQSVSHGNAKFGSTCLFDNVTACVQAPGCAWCPTTYECHSYDEIQGHFCDKDLCSAPPMVDHLVAGQPVVIPDCVKNVDVEANHAEIFDTIDEGEALLPGHIRLPKEYRNDMGEHSNAKAAPIHPSIDGELGDPVVILDAAYQNDIINEKNRVASGNVYLPPSPSDAAPCMNGGQDDSKTADLNLKFTAEEKMNVPPQDDAAATFVISPIGDVNDEENKACARKLKANVTGTHDVTSPSQESAAPVPVTEKYAPKQGVLAPAFESYQPASTSTRREEDQMNSDDTAFADLKARWVDAAEDLDYTRAPKRTDETAYKPKEVVAPRSPSKLIPQGVLRVEEEAFNPNLMNQGLPTQLMANPDCTETGGNDGISTTTFSSAMKNSASPSMPETLEAQLNLFKDESKATVDNNMFGIPQAEENLEHNLPVAAPEYQQVLPPIKDYGTEINGVSTDEEGARIAAVRHK